MHTEDTTYAQVSLENFYWGIVALAHKDYDAHDRLWYGAHATGATSAEIMAVYTPASILHNIALYREYPSKTFVHYIEEARAAGIPEEHIERALNCSTPPIKWEPPKPVHQPTLAEGYGILTGPVIQQYV